MWSHNKSVPLGLPSASFRANAGVFRSLCCQRSKLRVFGRFMIAEKSWRACRPRGEACPGSYNYIRMGIVRSLYPARGRSVPRFSLASRHNFTLPCRTWNNRRARCHYCTGARPKNEGLGRPPTAVRREKNRVIKDAMWGMHLCRRAGVASMAFLRIDCGNLEPKVGVPVCWPPSLDTPRRPSSCCNTTASSHKMGRAFGVKSTHRTAP